MGITKGFGTEQEWVVPLLVLDGRKDCKITNEKIEHNQ